MFEHELSTCIFVISLLRDLLGAVIKDVPVSATTLHPKPLGHKFKSIPPTRI